MQKLEYLKRFQTALNTYNEETQNIDLEQVRQMYEYAINTDSLNPVQKKKH